jgi:hypothetical protein
MKFTPPRRYVAAERISSGARPKRVPSWHTAGAGKLKRPVGQSFNSHAYSLWQGQLAQKRCVSGIGVQLVEKGVSGHQVDLVILSVGPVEPREHLISFPAVGMHESCAVRPGIAGFCLQASYCCVGFGLTAERVVNDGEPRVFRAFVLSHRVLNLFRTNCHVCKVSHRDVWKKRGFA